MNDRLVHTSVPGPADDTALLRAADAAGHGSRVRDLLAGGLAESARGDAELMRWAADYGAFALIVNRLEPDTTGPLLRIARQWAGTDPVTELSRRLGTSGTVTRWTVPIDDYTHTDCVRVTAPDGRWAETQTAHLAIVTYLEELLGIGVPPDELLARALVDRDPGGAGWSQAWHTLASRADPEETLRWAAGVLTAPDRDARWFAADVAHLLAIHDVPCPPETTALLRQRLATEPDPGVLAALIGAAVEFHGPGLQPEVAAHATHPDPSVRRRVAGELCQSVPDSVPLLVRLAADPDGEVRATALRVLRDYAFDHPETGRLLTVLRTDPDPRVRVEALAGLARAGDLKAFADLRQLADEAGEGSPAAALAAAAGSWLRTRRRQTDH
ncbi:HEAT repeat domain-containing protein [Actinoplanes sp. G11-F43]|uniref:HEAT repeat domain-containing protein n=1 Tax=Actinoplanes sp. G11-F43 TaxID=3424130 RepID=UPI003D3388CA